MSSDSRLFSRRIATLLFAAVFSFVFTPRAMAACTLFASPSGSYLNSGLSTSTATSLLQAVRNTKPGSVVCLLQGTYAVDTPFSITHSGTPSAWITYMNYNGGTVTLVPKSGTRSLLWLGPGIRYVEIKGLHFEGQNTANTAIACSGCDHVRIIGNKIGHMGAAGVATYPDPGSGIRPDYLTVDHNQIYHVGYNQGFGSAISFRRHRWSDSGAGFHSYVTNNMISGTYDNSSYHTDGNGIITDNDSGDNEPPVLIANNLVYQNGRRCIFERYATGTWVVNNTCYKNILYTKTAGEFQTYYSSGVYEVNNLSFAWNSNYAFLDGAPITNTRYHYNHWVASGSGTIHVVPSSAALDSAALLHANPYFVNPPYVSATGTGQYNNAVPPSQITNQFHLQSGSPALHAGIDPTTISGISSAIISGLKQYIYTDIAGNPRTPGSRFDLGAYAYTQGPVIATLTPTADTFVSSGALNINYGSSTLLKVGGSGVEQTSYLKFDLLSLAGKSVTSAKLRLWVYNGANGTYAAHAVSDTSWTELGTTYLNKSSIGSGLSSVSNPVSDTWVEFDVTSAVRANLGQLASFAITSTSADTLLLDSRQVAYMKPQLVIR